MKRIFLIVGISLLLLSVFFVVSGTREIKYSFIEIEKGSISERVSAEKSKLVGDIVYAQNTILSFDSNKLGKIEIEAQKSVYNLRSGIIEISGNIKLKARDLYAETDKAKIFVEDKTVKKIEGYGNVKVQTNGRTIKSEKAEIFPQEKMIIFTGNPVIQQKGLQIQGKTIKIFLDSDIVEVDETKARMEK